MGGALAQMLGQASAAVAASSAIRTNSKLFVNAGINDTLPLPTGSIAGDTMNLFAGHGLGVSSPGLGWTPRSDLTGSNYGGCCFRKVADLGRHHGGFSHPRFWRRGIWDDCRRYDGWLDRPSHYRSGTPTSRTFRNQTEVTGKLPFIKRAGRHGECWAS